MNQAIARKKPAAPIIWLSKNKLFPSGDILHFGRGKDTPGTKILKKFGQVFEYDPNISDINDPTILQKKYNVVVSCFVLNCIQKEERNKTLNIVANATLNTGSAFISVRSIKDSNLKVKQKKWTAASDGFTNGKIFQKFYTPENLIDELKKHFKTVFILYGKGGSITAQASHIKLPVRSVKFRVGKQMVGCVYIHKSSEHVLPEINKIKKHIPKNYDYDIVKFNWLKNTFSFIQCPDFALQSEPVVGNSLIVNSDGKSKLITAPQDPWIYHHKWLMVNDSYRGFNVPQSKSRSIKWMSLKPNRSKIGKQSYWNKNILPLL